MYHFEENFRFIDSSRFLAIKGGMVYSVPMEINNQIDPRIIHRGIEIAADAFDVGQITPAFEEDVRNHLIDHHVLFVYALNDAQDDKPIGFMSCKYLTVGDMGILYISGTAIEHKYQARGVNPALATEAIRIARESQPIHLVGSRTQNPAVVKARTHYCDLVYPTPLPPNEEVVRAAQSLHSFLGLTQPLDPDTLVLKNAYTNPMYKSRPVSGHPAIDAFFTQHVGPRDAILTFGQPRF